MDKGIPLPELPLEPVATKNPVEEHVPLILGIILFTLGTGTMITLSLLSVSDKRALWPLPLPLALMGLGLLLYHFLASRRER
jgi:hypothetical protein